MSELPTELLPIWADDLSKKLGWTMNTDFLDRLCKDTLEITGYDATWEVAEYIYLRAIGKIPDNFSYPPNPDEKEFEV